MPHELLFQYISWWSKLSRARSSLHRRCSQWIISVILRQSLHNWLTSSAYSIMYWFVITFGFPSITLGDFRKYSQHILKENEQVNNTGAVGSPLSSVSVYSSSYSLCFALPFTPYDYCIFALIRQRPRQSSSFNRGHLTSIRMNI